MGFRVAVFTTKASGALLKETLRALIDRMPDCEILVLERVRPHAPGHFAKSQLQNVQRHGWRWLPFQGRNVMVRVARPLRDAVETQRLRIFRLTDGVLTDPRVTLRRFSSLRAPEAVAALNAWAPDLGVSLGAPLLRPEVYSVPRLGTVNLHQGKLPDYRGMPPAFWEIQNGETSTGVAVHQVDEGLDTGDVLLKETVAIERFATPAGVRVRLDSIGSRLIVGAVAGMRAGALAGQPQGDGGRTYTRPTLLQEEALDVRIHGERRARAKIKSAVFASYAKLGTLQKRGRESVIVLLYHRVTDAYRDNVTIGVERFRDQMAYLSDHHRVVSLDDLIAGPQRGGDGPIVAITFDDGYLDNYEYAAPILARLGLPTTFFVSTTIADQRLPFQHDLDMYGHGLPMMSWEQMREMQAAGFAFGAHTATHPNLARIDEAAAETELRLSKEKLAVELGVTAAAFAYPFGKRDDFNAERLAQVKALGYTANCSAYGGVNGLAVDRWDIRRQGIDWNFDVPALSARLMGWGRETHV